MKFDHLIIIVINRHLLILYMELYIYSSISNLVYGILYSNLYIALCLFYIFLAISCVFHGVVFFIDILSYL